MRTPKIVALYRAINWFDKFFNYGYIYCLDLDQSDLDSNAWLAGFTNKSFFISTSKRENYFFYFDKLIFILKVNFILLNPEGHEKKE